MSVDKPDEGGIGPDTGGGAVQNLGTVEGPLPRVQERDEKGMAGPRIVLTVGFAALFTLTVVGAFVASFTSHWVTTKDWLLIVLPVETALLGSVMGYYFGSQKGRI